MKLECICLGCVLGFLLSEFVFETVDTTKPDDNTEINKDSG